MLTIVVAVVAFLADGAEILSFLGVEPSLHRPARQQPPEAAPISTALSFQTTTTDQPATSQGSVPSTTTTSWLPSTAPQPTGTRQSTFPTGTVRVGAESPLGRAMITAVRATDGKSGYGSQLAVDLTVTVAPDRRHTLWLISQLHPHPPTIQRTTFYAKGTIPSVAGQYSIPVALGTAGSVEVGLVRTFLIVSADSSASQSLQVNRAHEGDPAWDGNRLSLPSGVFELDASAPITRTRP